MRSDVFNRHMKRKDHMQEGGKQDLQANNLSDKRDKIFDIDQNNDAQCESDDNSLPQEKDGDKIGMYAWKASRVNRNHHFLFPRNIRAIVCGKSGVGKTCLVTYLLLKPDTLDYNKLIICGKSLHQPEYKIMKATFSRGWPKNQVNKLFEL